MLRSTERRDAWSWRRCERDGGVPLETAAIVLGIIALKLVLEAVSAEFITLSPLYTSVVAGGIFVIGLIVAGTLADYKEAEKMPPRSPPPWRISAKTASR